MSKIFSLDSSDVKAYILQFDMPRFTITKTSYSYNDKHKL